MSGAIASLDEFLKGKADFAAEAPIAGRIAWLSGAILVCGMAYGAVMGSFTGLSQGKEMQILYSSVKVPFLLLSTFLLCVPSYYVLNAVAGLASDFGHAFRGVVATQACVTVVLASLAPVTALFYLSVSDYNTALAFNGLVFAVASFTAQAVLNRYYRPLERKSPRHRIMKAGWLLLYVFVAIQMGWILRPFIGSPGMEVSFFRSGPLGNAYVVVAKVVLKAAQNMAG